MSGQYEETEAVFWERLANLRSTQLAEEQEYVETLRRELAHRNERLLTFAGIAERLAEAEQLAGTLSSEYCIWRQEEITCKARLAEAETALQQLMEAANDSDGCQYGTLSTSFVRDLCKRGLRAADSAPADAGCWPFTSIPKAAGSAKEEMYCRECQRCYKPLVSGRGGCEGSQHGNTGCAMNSPSYTRYEGRCNHCGSLGAFLRAGTHACIWGGCNGTVNAVATRVGGAP